MIRRISTPLGKGIKTISKLRGGGSALPGLVVEKIDPDFLRRTLSQLPKGVVLISGTNGKTTTTKMVVELLESRGLKVLTNRSGSNFVRGVIASLLESVDIHGKLNADIAVLELDEAHAVHFVKQVAPTYSLLLNVMRDQLDRFGEIDYTAGLLTKIAQATTGAVVLNREDQRVRNIASLTSSSQPPTFFGLSDATRSLFPDDDSLRKPSLSAEPLPPAYVTLDALHGQTATFSIGTQVHTLNLRLSGLYNIYNAAAALALVSKICNETIKTDALLSTLSQITPAFGRGETFSVDGQPLELVLVKNPSGFRLGLSSFNAKNTATMIAVNDNYADGRDMSWLWDVEFNSLREDGVACVSGIRAYDMALRLQYDEVEIGHVSTELEKSLRHFIRSNSGTPKRIYCTYTAMLQLRRELAKFTKVEAI